MSKFKQIQKDLMSSVKDSTKAKTKPYDATANVTRIEDGVMYVHIPGGIDETPVEMTINAMPGDLVKVRVANGRAWVTGNHTAPPTDDTTANNAARVARKAQRVAVQASEEATEAWAYAGTAAEAAVAAKTSADSAHEAAENAWDRAGEAKEAADAAAESAEEAKESARSANRSANNALIQLSVVEDVAGTLRWISEHGDYVLTEDTTVHSDTVYFVYQYGDYVPIANPPAGSNPAALGWYVLDVTQSTTDYIMSHLAVTNYGLWVLPVNNLAEHSLKDSGGNLIIDGDGDEIVDFSDDPQNATGYKVLLSGGTDNPNFPIGLSIFNDEGALIANYGESTTIGEDSGYNVHITDQYVQIRDGDTVLAQYGSDTIIGESSGKHIGIDSNSVSIEDGDDLLIGFDEQGMKFYDPDTGNVSAEIKRYSNGNAYIKLGPNGSQTAESTLNAGELSFGGHTSADAVSTGVYKASFSYAGILYNNFYDFVGTVVQDEGSLYSATVSVPNQSWTTWQYPLTLTQGTWIVLFGCAFQANTSGGRQVALNTSSGSSVSTTRFDLSATGSSGDTKLHGIRIQNVANEGFFDYYIHLYQSSGTSLTAYPYIKAIKIL